MSGLFLLAVVGAWLWIAYTLSRSVGKLTANDTWSGPLSVLLFVVLVPLPVIDEIIGGFQLRELCSANAAEFRLGVANPEGRTVRVTFDPSDEHLRGTAIPIRHSRIRYHDVGTGALVVEFDEYVAKGGHLIKALGISENNSPLTIGSPSCSPERRKAENVRRTLKFNVIN